MKMIKAAFLISFSISLTGCGCYDSYEDAWEACNDKYNGKCSYLGKDFKVCESPSFYSSRSYDKCIEKVRVEGISEGYCSTEQGRKEIFNANL